MNELKDLRVFLSRLSEDCVEEYWKKYQENLIIETDNEEFNAQELVTPFLQETGLNVSVIAKNDKKLVKLNTSQLIAAQLEPSLEHRTDSLMSDNQEQTNGSTTTLSSYPFQCSKCIKMFKDQIEFNTHLLSHNENQNLTSAKQKSRTTLTKLICNECGMQFFQQGEFNRHLLTHEGIKPFKCSICSMQFYDTSSKNRHEKEHSGLKPFRCFICSFEFTRASNLRAHLLKVHSSEIGKSVIISKSSDNKLQFHFDSDAIKLYREQQRLQKMNRSSSDLNHTERPPTNAVIYIKDPKDKNSDVQHMVVYVDGKPVFLQNQKIPSNQTQSSNGHHHLNHQQQQQQPVKIPYLLAAAAAAAAASQSRCTLNTTYNSSPITKQTNPTPVSQQPPKNEIKKDFEYQQLVSMLKQKNEKLHNPLATNNFVTNEKFSNDSILLHHQQQNNHFI